MKLKRCPFCGGRPELTEVTDGPNVGGSFIECRKCRASSPVMLATKCDAGPLLAESWNARDQRAVDAASDMLAELLAMEWSDCHRGHEPDDPTVEACPRCGGVRPSDFAARFHKRLGHRPGCRLAAVIAKARGEPT